jgi:hypothetical protein
MLTHNLHYPNFTRRLILRPRIVVRVGGCESSDAAAPPLAPPTVPPLRRDLLLTLCKVVKRALFSNPINFLIVAASFSYYSCT